ncbi:unnamed protein product [Darwinula stevensoni]|uniref:Uncharacterized protein n=1 Tax=Darwinula stevensoni TaxID=69355 RepID=A0A7R9A0S8_9CRUS|nr:unnamed protein product [Darwinula stevensoni]CAG0886215.1 unnamed protein product [Darwinula stevensoni]
MGGRGESIFTKKLPFRSIKQEKADSVSVPVVESGLHVLGKGLSPVECGTKRGGERECRCRRYMRKGSSVCGSAATNSQPVNVEQEGKRREVPPFSIQVPVEELDVGYYLPLFFDGLVEVEFPYEFIARKGVFDLLDAASPKLLQLLPTLIPPLRRAMNSRDPGVMKTALKVIEKMATSGDTGQGLVPYYRHFLPPLNLFIYRDRNLEDGIDYGQNVRESLSALIWETLEILERTGGPLAFINIKYVIPTYESSLIY